MAEQESDEVGSMTGALPATLVENTLFVGVDGMTCASCAGRVERTLSAVPGVLSAYVNLASEKATIRYAEGAVSPSVVLDAIVKAGYGARRLTLGPQNKDESKRQLQERRSLRRSVVLAAAATLPVFVLEMSRHISLGNGFGTVWLGHHGVHYLEFLLTTLVLFGPGFRFFKKGLLALLDRAPDMNTLVALGAGAAWGYSTVVIFASELLPQSARHVYLEAAAVIVTLILVGKLLEARAKGRAGDAIRRLVGLQPKISLVIRAGKNIQLPVAEIRTGDIILMRPGQRIPVDGEVIDGSSYVDESMITGEPSAVHKYVDTEVIGGTVNKTGSITFRATKVGGDMVLSQIVRMVEEAQGSKLPMQALVDRVTAVFVPIVISVAAITFLAWFFLGSSSTLTFALTTSVAVLIIACPCAMGLATPTSIMVGTGRGAELGILFRKSEALQRLADAKVVAFDKTGTLTTGAPELTDILPRNGFKDTEVLELVASVEELSEHPFAAAIVASARARGLKLKSAQGLEAFPGYGIAATVVGRRIEVGADRYMDTLGYELGQFAQVGQDLAVRGKSPIYVAIDGVLAAVIAVADQVKPTSADAVDALRSLGLTVAMITGDNLHTGQAVADQLGIKEIFAEVLPDGKVKAIKALNERFGSVAFAGDGINDAPALAAADVGLAIGTGADVAIESADAVLMSGDLRGVPTAIALSRATILNIKQNLFWAFAYNVILVPVAAGALYPLYGLLLSPAFAAGAMATSSAFVVGNALRLRRFRSAAARTKKVDSLPMSSVAAVARSSTSWTE